jgi:NADH-quinone oxidoreductase subunit C/D
MNEGLGIIAEMEQRFGAGTLAPQATVDGIPTVWAPAARVREVLRWLKNEAAKPYKMLYDLTAIDERVRTKRAGQPKSDFTVLYHLYSFERNEYLRVKAALAGEFPTVATITDLWPAANWYEREMWDMFGIRVEEHPNLRRLLMPDWWEGHPLRKDYPARATELPPYTMSQRKAAEEQEALQFKPEEWGMVRRTADKEFMFLNLGPHHLGTHGLLRMILQLDDEEIVEAVADIGYHHRGAEKMGERQSWHTFIPYTDRIDYLGGVMNNLPYVLAVEKLAGIEVPERVKVIRVMLCELFRIASHLVWYGTFASDLGAMSPVLFTFNDRERVLGIIEAITGGRMHPSWFRIGGVSQDLPKGWDRLVREFLDYLPPKMAEYDTLVMGNDILRARTIGVGGLSTAEAIEWGVTGANLRATGLEWDFRKKQPYSGYEQFEFDIPTAQGGDCYARAQVRVEEIRQSLRIVEQCLNNMPEGPYKADHPLTTPPRKERTTQDIATLVNHFLGVSWGPVIPAGESFVGIEATKGNNGYYLVSDGSTMSYRTRIRTPSFAHIQLLPRLARGLIVSDLIAILGALDFVLGDVDR